MSFDLYFVPNRPDGNWEAAMDALERAAEIQQPFSAGDEALWGRIKAEPELEGWEEFVGEYHRELDHEQTGMQLSMSVGEISLTVPYWESGEGAVRTAETLRSIAISVEAVTGLVAYDRQADELFLAGEPSATAETFDSIRKSLDEHYPSEPTPPAPQRWWQRFRRSSS